MRRNRRVGQGIERGVAYGLEDRGDIGIGGTSMAAFKGIERGEQFAGQRHGRR